MKPHTSWIASPARALVATCLTLAMGTGPAPTAWAQTAAPAAAACPPVATAPSQAQVQQALQQAQDRGLLWRITKDGRQSYLYGTLHIGKLEWLFPGPRMREALTATDTLALELDQTDPATLQSLQSGMNSKPSQPLSADLQSRLAAQRVAACLPAGALDSMHPALQAVTLSMLVGRWIGLDAGFGSEVGLAGRARRLGQKIVALETAERQLQVLIPNDQPERLSEMIRSSLDQLESGKGRELLSRLANAWEHGRAADFESYEQWCECVKTESDRAFMKRLNDERNPAMAQAIDKLHSQGSKVFAAIGSLHMFGEAGLPKLMAAHGYQVERVSFAPLQ